MNTVDTQDPEEQKRHSALLKATSSAKPVEAGSHDSTAAKKSGKAASERVGEARANTVDTALDERLDAILDDMNWGYQFQMSDYSTSRAQEKEYEAAGLEEIATAKREIKALISSLTNEAELRGRVDELELYDCDELGYFAHRKAALLKLSGASSRQPERSQETKPRKEGL